MSGAATSLLRIMYTPLSSAHHIDNLIGVGSLKSIFFSFPRVVRFAEFRKSAIKSSKVPVEAVSCGIADVTFNSVFFDSAIHHILLLFILFISLKWRFKSQRHYVIYSQTCFEILFFLFEFWVSIFNLI